MTQIPIRTSTVNMSTGETEKTEVAHMTLLPCDTSKGQCAYCAAVHLPNEPHNAQSLYYQYRIYGERGIWPNWGNAMEHCDGATRQRWKAELVSRGVTIDQLVPRAPAGD